jgi:hypothetical protein
MPASPGLGVHDGELSQRSGVPNRVDSRWLALSAIFEGRVDLGVIVARIDRLRCVLSFETLTLAIGVDKDPEGLTAKTHRTPRGRDDHEA